MESGLEVQERVRPPEGRPAPRSMETPVAVSPDEVRRLRYFVELLDLGFRSAATLGPGVECPRGERIALGIDHPELDTVPYWSCRREDGRIAIPFIELILHEIEMSLERLHRTAPGGRPRALLGAGRRVVTRVLERIGDGTAVSWKRPPAGDRFVSEKLLRPVCGPGSLLLPIVKRYEGAPGGRA